MALTRDHREGLQPAPVQTSHRPESAGGPLLGPSDSGVEGLGLSWGQSRTGRHSPGSAHRFRQRTRSDPGARSLPAAPGHRPAPAPWHPGEAQLAVLAPLRRTSLSQLASPAWSRRGRGGPASRLPSQEEDALDTHETGHCRWLTHLPTGWPRAPGRGRHRCTGPPRQRQTPLTRHVPPVRSPLLPGQTTRRRPETEAPHPTGRTGGRTRAEQVSRQEGWPWTGLPVTSLASCSPQIPWHRGGGTDVTRWAPRAVLSRVRVPGRSARPSPQRPSWGHGLETTSFPWTFSCRWTQHNALLLLGQGRLHRGG
ncbi:uncharacterized protein LOC144367593 [Ictidomys tridecemlineatus]